MPDIHIPTIGKEQATAPQLTLPPALIAGAQLGNDIHTFNGWMATVDSYLSMLPEGAAMLDGKCLVYRANDHLWEVFASTDGTCNLKVDLEGSPVDFGICDQGAFSEEDGCWDSHIENPVAGRAFVTSPRFVQLQLSVCPEYSTPSREL